MGTRLFPIGLAIALSGLAVAFGFGWGSGLLEQWQLAARYTARVGLPLFLITYCASSLARLWPGDGTRAILRHRRQWGLSFALTHSVHLMALALYNAVAGTMPSATTLMGGGGAYALLYAMALTSNDASVRALGPWWKRLHTLGIHWLWFIFAFSYAGRIGDPARRAEGLLFFGLCIAALALRVAAQIKRKRG
jgi:DMSO/TMAO reductase YedYZ heme-binding membrane subunit